MFRCNTSVKSFDELCSVSQYNSQRFFEDQKYTYRLCSCTVKASLNSFSSSHQVPRFPNLAWTLGPIPPRGPFKARRSPLHRSLAKHERSSNPLRNRVIDGQMLELVFFFRHSYIDFAWIVLGKTPVSLRRRHSQASSC